MPETEIKSINKTKNKKANEVLEGRATSVKLSIEEIIDILNEPIDNQILDGDSFEILNWMNKVAGQDFTPQKELDPGLINKSDDQDMADTFVSEIEKYYAQLNDLKVTETDYPHFLDKFKHVDKEKLRDKVGRRAVIKQFVCEELKNSDIEGMFPEEYADPSNSLGDFSIRQDWRFPTSKKYRIEWHANCINVEGRNLILSAGVPATIKPNSVEIAEFFRSILIYQPSIIFAVAKFEEDIQKEKNSKNSKQEETEESKKVTGLLKYIKPGFYGDQRQYQITTKLTEDEGIIELTITNLKTKDSHTSLFVNISTDDNKPVSFDFKACQKFLSLYDSLLLGKSNIMIHCMSGIGRTGFLAMMFLLLDKILQRYDIEKSLVKSLTESIDKSDIENLLVFRKNLLLINQIRTIRGPFLQDKFNQGYSLMKAFLLLLLVRKKLVYQSIMVQTKKDLLFNNYSPTPFRQFTQEEIEQDTIDMSITELKEIFDELKKSGHDGSVVNVIYNTFIGNSSIFNNKTKLDELKSLLDKVEKYETAAAFNVDCLKIINQFKDWESNGKKYGRVVELIKSYCERRELKPEIKSEQCSII